MFVAAPGPSAVPTEVVELAPPAPVTAADAPWLPAVVDVAPALVAGSAVVPLEPSGDDGFCPLQAKTETTSQALAPEAETLPIPPNSPA